MSVVGKYLLGKALPATQLIGVGGGPLASAEGAASAIRGQGKALANARAGRGADSINKPKPPNPPKIASFTKEVGGAFRGNLVKGLAGLGAASVIGGGVYGVSKLIERASTHSVWRWLKQNHPELTKSPGAKENFAILVKYAPGLAENNQVAFSYLQRANQLGMTPHEFVSDLVSIQEKINKSNLGSQMLSSVMPGKMR